MEELLKKITQYQLFNFLLTGTVFAVAVSKTTPINLLIPDILAAFFVYYFIGLIISRLGSLIIEPLFKRLRVVSYAPYADYLKAQKNDPKLDVLSQENNLYRTLVVATIFYLVLYIASKNIHSLDPSTQSLIIVIGALTLLTLMIFAYRKQTLYISTRVKKGLEHDGKN